MDKSVDKKNLLFYPVGTIGRDMVYCLITNFLLTYILFTKQLNGAQLAAITAIMAGARVFDALNDPIMGNIIERTRGKYGKFKPWLVIGILSTGFVVAAIFNSRLSGWSFIIFFGIFYILFSITYTMHDISYWGMVPALSSDANLRNQLTSRATLMAGIGGTLASMLIPILTAGEHAIASGAAASYGIVSVIVCILAPVFLAFTIFGVKERRDTEVKPAEPFSFRKIVQTIARNDQLVWISVIFLIQQVGNGIVIGGLGATYIYFAYGYRGGLYSLFSTIGVSATAFLMIFYPAISRKMHRKKLMNVLAVVAMAGYAAMVLSVFLSGSMAGFWILTVGYTLSAFGQYGYYLVMMISIINTVEYNEYRFGTRDEAIITSLRPFLTKMSSAIIVILTTVSYALFKATSFMNGISGLEQEAELGTITETEKLSSIDSLLSGVTSGQSLGLLLCMTILPCALLLLSNLLYQKHYKLDEEEYERICKELSDRHSKE
ncbi:MAG: glycoside-pentoside-hexuronide (GPH):cation symporter [Lachnospiraceae bacterium]|nr:glycoside-pentoside-hexuronide (GPH):cation symporter [Lachnospiraceae bacterium]